MASAGPKAIDAEAIALFKSVTGANDVEARHFLEMADGNVEAAANLFFTSNDGGGASAAAAGSAGGVDPNALRMTPEGVPADVEAFVSAVRSNEALLAQITASNPPLAQTIRAGNVAGVRDFFSRVASQKAAELRRRQQELELLTADPFDPEAQQRIADRIRQDRVDESLDRAMEDTPELFGQVVMLYVNMEVNGVPLKAFIDSGAQMTIMSRSCAERCNIRYLVDERWTGVAKGVGEAKILGRVHQAPVKVGDKHMPCAITVLEQEGMDFLFGLDNLRRYQCNIDLKTNTLRFPSLDNLEAPFLTEGELPAHLRQPHKPEDADGKGAS